MGNKQNENTVSDVCQITLTLVCESSSPSDIIFINIH